MIQIKHQIFVNDFDWKSNNNYLFNNVEKIIRKIRNINYVSKI